jgi:hypothetical protein
MPPDLCGRGLRQRQRPHPDRNAFPNDDVCPDGQPDVSGSASDGNLQCLTVTVA